LQVEIDSLKSTVSAYIATKLNVPHISLDKLFWGPGWAVPSDDEFKERISAAITQNSKGWVIDGNGSHSGTLISDHATDVICMSFDFWLIYTLIS
jgi:adenylate kinase family enzyme